MRDDIDRLLDKHNETARYFRKARAATDSAIAALDVALNRLDVTYEAVRATVEAARDTVRSVRDARNAHESAIAAMLAANEAALRLRNIHPE